MKDSLNSMIELLKEDAKRAEPRYPAAAVAGLQDDRVVEAIRSRFEQGSTLVGVEPLGYNFFTGLNHTFYEFRAGNINLERDAILIITDSDCSVVGVVDPFDPDQPNRFLPRLPARGDVPFLLRQPTASDQLFFSEEDLLPRDLRSREFFERLGMDRHTGADTVCSHSTTYRTPVGRSCKQMTGMFACDQWGTDYVTDERTDEVEDDCGHDGLFDPQLP